MQRVKSSLLGFVLLAITLSGCLGFGEDDKATDSHSHDCPEDGADHMDGGMMAENGTVEGETTMNTTLLKLQQPVQTNQTMVSESGNVTMEDAGGHDHDVECPPTTVVAENMAPIPALTMTGPEGELGNHSWILPGDVITFSARNSSDPDGTISLAVLQTTDTNGTRTFNLLGDSGMVDVVVKFDRVGPVNVTLKLLDDRGDAAQLDTMAYVNEQFIKQGEAVGPFTGDNIDDCTSAEAGTGQTLTRGYHWYETTFGVGAGARWITAMSSGNEEVGICTADDTILAKGDGSAATDDMDLAPSVGYRLIVLPDGPNDSFTVTVTVHYEPKPVE